MVSGQADDPSMRAAFANAIVDALRQSSGQADPDGVFREAVLWVRLADPAWYPLGGVEPLA